MHRTRCQRPRRLPLCTLGRVRRIFVFVGGLVAIALGGCQRHAPPVLEGTESLKVRVLASYPHDPNAFTQGLLMHRGKVFESTGLHGRSGVRRVELTRGEVEQRAELPTDLFGEGLALVDRDLIQLTWRNEKAIYWDLVSLRPYKEIAYEGEGWGLCFDGERLVMSDGSDRLTFRDPRSFAALGQVRVRKDGAPVTFLNELECVEGHVYANVWQQEVIARIDPKTGNVTAWIDASGLLAPLERAGTDVLNGIAHVPDSDKFLLTGKNWPKLFEVQFVPAEERPQDEAP